MFSLKTHNILDYIGAALLLSAPTLLGFSALEDARNLFLGAGSAWIIYSLITKYQYSIWGIIPFTTHLVLDIVCGLAILVGPWVLGYRNQLSTVQELGHYLIALALFGFVAATRSNSGLATLNSETFSELSDYSDYPDHRRVG